MSTEKQKSTRHASFRSYQEYGIRSTAAKGYSDENEPTVCFGASIIKKVGDKPSLVKQTIYLTDSQYQAFENFKASVDIFSRLCTKRSCNPGEPCPNCAHSIAKFAAKEFNEQAKKIGMREIKSKQAQNVKCVYEEIALEMQNWNDKMAAEFSSNVTRHTIDLPAISNRSRRKSYSKSRARSKSRRR